jgi:hypothetical protein
MTKNEATELAKVVDGEVRDDYSGRGMFGNACYGVVVDSLDDLFDGLADYIHDIKYECSEDPEMVGEALKKLRIDEMGLQKILY